MLGALVASAPSPAAAVDVLLAARALRSSTQPQPASPASGALLPSFADAVGTLWHAPDPLAPASGADGDAWVPQLLSAQPALAAALLPPHASPSALVSLLRAGRRNNFAVADDLLTPLAAASFPYGALLNHACDANCVISYERDGAGWAQRVRAVRAIAPEEVRWQLLMKL